MGRALAATILALLLAAAAQAGVYECPDGTLCAAAEPRGCDCTEACGSGGWRFKGETECRGAKAAPKKESRPGGECTEQTRQAGMKVVSHVDRESGSVFVKAIGWAGASYQERQSFGYWAWRCLIGGRVFIRHGNTGDVLAVYDEDGYDAR